MFKRYPELLKPKLFELLDDEKGRHSWIDLLSTGYPQEQGEEEPMYMLIPIDEWFLWLDKAKEWFKKDIPHWENEIEKELLHNAHEKAIYD